MFFVQNPCLAEKARTNPFMFTGRKGTITATDEATEALRRSLHDHVFFREDHYTEIALAGASEVLVAQRRGDRECMMERLDELLGFLLENWSGCVDPRQLRRMQRKIPQPISASAFPVILMTELLQNRHVRCDFSKLSNWKRFAQRYGPALL